MQDLEAQLKEVRASLADAQQSLAAAAARNATLEEDMAKLSKAHGEAVQEAVGLRISTRKTEEALQAKMAEAAGEAQRAAEAHRLLETAKRDLNERSLRGALRMHGRS
jgi:hypothetical protein